MPHGVVDVLYFLWAPVRGLYALSDAGRAGGVAGRHDSTGTLAASLRGILPALSIYPIPYLVIPLP